MFTHLLEVTMKTFFLYGDVLVVHKKLIIAVYVAFLITYIENIGLMGTFGSLGILLPVAPKSRVESFKGNLGSD